MLYSMHPRLNTVKHFWIFSSILSQVNRTFFCKQQNGKRYFGKYLEIGLSNEHSIKHVINTYNSAVLINIVIIMKGCTLKSIVSHL